MQIWLISTIEYKQACLYSNEPVSSQNKLVLPKKEPFLFETKRPTLDANLADFAAKQAYFEANQANFDDAICMNYFNSFACSVCEWFSIFLVRNCRSADLL